MEDSELEEIFYWIHDAFINRDFDYFYEVIDYYNEIYNEDVIFHMLSMFMNKITQEDDDYDVFNELLNYTLEKIDINRVSTSGYTPASIMIIEILKNIRGRWGEDPEDYFQFIDILFNQYVDMNAGFPSLNDIIRIKPREEQNIAWCKNEIKKMIDFKKSENMKQAQALSFTSSLNPSLGNNSLLQNLDLDTITKIYGYIKTPKPEIYDKSDKEYKLDPLLKAKQRLAYAKGFSDPNSHIRFREDHLRDDIGELVSKHRPYPSVQKRHMLEDENERIADYLNTIEQYGMGKRSKGKHSKNFAKRTQKNRRKKNRF